ncbi:MAG: hypothetical protein JWO84_653 [Parcubacteria group bacterium]|nr:hypothetical protein [Parcubacteria group bacterium]
MNILDQIGDTPLIRFSGEVPNNNRIWLKLECDNPFGSHYDRVYLRLFKHFEEQGLLRPGATVLETTSGSAGVSFAGIGTLLGYKCLVAIPEGGEKAREEAIRRAGAELIFTPAESYVNGFPRFAARFLAKNREVVFLNHSMGPNGSENGVAVEALGTIGEELRSQLDSVDCFIAAVGNGSSVLGPARMLYPRTSIVTFESFQSATAYDLLYPGEYERLYGIAPGSLPRHQLPGTSFPGIDFPHIRLAFKDEQLVERTVLVSDERTNDQYLALTGNLVPASLPRWDTVRLPPYGRTTRAGLAVALHLAEQMENKNIVLLAYDKEDRYDT